MGVPTSEDGYTSAKTGKGDHEVNKEHVVTLGELLSAVRIPQMDVTGSKNC
jgi:hypothetical protein